MVLAPGTKFLKSKPFQKNPQAMFALRKVINGRISLSEQNLSHVGWYSREAPRCAVPPRSGLRRSHLSAPPCPKTGRPLAPGIRHPASQGQAVVSGGRVTAIQLPTSGVRLWHGLSAPEPG